MHLPEEINAAVLAHARFCAPEEACGLLAFDDRGELRMAYCLSNADRSAISFTVDPDEHFAALRHAERRGWTIGGAFHSHPRGSAVPSRRDVAGALDPDWLQVIVGLGTDPEQVRGWRVRNGVATEVAMTVGEGASCR